MKTTPQSPCCTWSCDASKGCLAGHDQLVWQEITPPEKGDEFDDDDLPWSALDRAESLLVWLIVWLCALLLAYLAYLAWQQFT